MVPLKKFKLTNFFLEKKNLFLNFFIAYYTLYKTDKCSPFNFFFNYRKCPKSHATVTLNTLYIKFLITI